MIKRAFDVFVSMLLLTLLLPFIILVVLINFFEGLFFKENKGPLLYSEIRISNGKPFKVLKFRIFKIQTINEYLNTHGFVQTKDLEQNNQNMTFIGRFLKQIYMDELPQLINVLKGEMALVGPRPSNEVVTWQDAQNGKFQRYIFRCGLTGPFQIVKDVKVSKSQNAFDMEYIEFCKNHSGIKIVLYDLYIIFKTILTVLRAKGV